MKIIENLELTYGGGRETPECDPVNLIEMFADLYAYLTKYTKNHTKTISADMLTRIIKKSGSKSIDDIEYNRFLALVAFDSQYHEFIVDHYDELSDEICDDEGNEIKSKRITRAIRNMALAASFCRLTKKGFIFEDMINLIKERRLLRNLGVNEITHEGLQKKGQLH